MMIFVTSSTVGSATSTASKSIIMSVQAITKTSLSFKFEESKVVLFGRKDHPALQSNHASNPIVNLRELYPMIEKLGRRYVGFSGTKPNCHVLLLGGVGRSCTLTVHGTAAFANGHADMQQRVGPVSMPMQVALCDGVSVMNLHCQGRKHATLVEDFDQAVQAMFKLRVLRSQVLKARPDFGLVPFRHHLQTHDLHESLYFQRRSWHGERALVPWMKNVGKGIGVLNPPMETTLPIMVVLDLRVVHIGHKASRVVPRWQLPQVSLEELHVPKILQHGVF